eukprot:TRINITY_DN23459_c0_g1_i1.p1 TRINITY_DN23459_c0_g1~~TRINITY_DN23459_c0_g1_i1.p1  ORF type:complete len:347 (-),score=74.08 TRINITY_DN23459_c0_g1_i1:34-1074(-)
MITCCRRRGQVSPVSKVFLEVQSPYDRKLQSDVCMQPAPCGADAARRRLTHIKAQQELRKRQQRQLAEGEEPKEATTGRACDELDQDRSCSRSLGEEPEVSRLHKEHEVDESIAKFGKTRGPPKGQEAMFLATLRRAEKLLNEGYWQPAIQEYDAVIALAPKDWRGHRGKVLAWEGLGNFLKAYSSCRRGMEELPKNNGLKALADHCRARYKKLQFQQREEEEARRAAHGRKTEDQHALTKTQAREILDITLEKIDQPCTERLRTIARQALETTDAIERMTLLGDNMFPELQKTLGPELARHSLPHESMEMLLDSMMQIQLLAAGDPEMQTKVQRIWMLLTTGKLE